MKKKLSYTISLVAFVWVVALGKAPAILPEPQESTPPYPPQPTRENLTDPLPSQPPAETSNMNEFFRKQREKEAETGEFFGIIDSNSAILGPSVPPHTYKPYPLGDLLKKTWEDIQNWFKDTVKSDNTKESEELEFKQDQQPSNDPRAP